MKGNNRNRVETPVIPGKVDTPALPGSNPADMTTGLPPGTSGVNPAMAVPSDNGGPVLPGPTYDQGLEQRGVQRPFAVAPFEDPAGPVEPLQKRGPVSQGLFQVAQAMQNFGRGAAGQPMEEHEWLQPRKARAPQERRIR